MMRNLVTLTLLLFLAAAMPAATVNTTLTVNASAATPTGTSLTATGTASLTNGIGSGTFTATFSLVTVSGPYTITLSNGTITGTITTTLAILSGSASGSATVTGGTGTFSGASGSFTLSGTGSAGATGNINLTFTGPGSITASGLTGGGTTGPAITQVLDAASITDTVAPGSIFIVKGTNLCPSGVNFFNTLPRPTVAPDGVKITFTPTAGGTSTDAILWYEYNPSGTCQLAAILPSTVAVGTYNVTVTNGTVSAPATAKVVQSKFGFFTQDSTGSGLAVAQTIITATRYDLNRFTSGSVSGVTISPSHPGAPMVTYGTGLGAVPASVGDNLALPIYDFTTHGVTVNAIVGGMTIPVSFAGRAGFAAEDQVNFTLPANVPTGCTVSFQLSVNGTLSAPTFLAIAPTTGATECVQPGFTAVQLKNFDNGGTYTVGNFSLSQVQETVPGFGTFTSNSANGAFTRFTGFELSGAAQAAPNTSGACTVVHSTSSTTPTIVAGGTGLDAGTVTLNGPTGSSISNLAFQQNTDPTNSSYNSYSLTLAGPAGGTGTIVPGTYTVAGAGGKDVNKFNSSITVGTPVTVTGGLPSSINRSAGLTLNWTGGNATDIVQLFGASSTTTGSGSSAVTDSWAFTCYTTAGAQTLTVPASILQQLPAATLSSSGSGGGLLTFSTSTVPSSFAATLAAGGSIDSGVFSAFVGTGALVSYQ